MSRIIEVHNPQAIIPYAEHFGVSVENFISSAPDIGIQAVEIAHSGLAIANPEDRLSSRLLSPQDLFKGTYEDNDTRPDSENISHGSDSYIAKAIIPEHVEDFSKQRNISPIVVSRVGMRVLTFAVEADAGVGADLGVYKGRTRYKKGKIDSHLVFSISTINTIAMSRVNRSKLSIFKRG